ncbi:MAG: efflux RND transporter periplasmic adaptor subunit [Candidatus Brocadiia bacterium]
MSSRFLSLLLCTACLLAAGVLAAGAVEHGRPEPELVRVEAFTAPYRDLDIASQVGGVVSSVEVEEGDHVEAGREMLRLRDDILKAELEVSRARAAAAEHKIAAAKTNYEYRARELEVVRALVKKEIEPPEEGDKARLEMELAQLSVKQAEAEKNVAELTAARDQAALDRTRIRAPVEGEVFRVLKRSGEAVEPLSPVVRLVTLAPLYVVARGMPIETMGRVKVGMEATIELENLPGRSLPCEVVLVDRVAEAASGTYRVKLELPNPDKNIPAGARGILTFELPPKTEL